MLSSGILADRLGVTHALEAHHTTGWDWPTYPQIAHPPRHICPTVAVWRAPLQVQVADIGLMGGPAKFNGKATEGVRIFLGGSIGEGAQLASEFEKGVACEESVLLPKLRELLIERFGAVPKAGVLVEA